MNPFSIVKILNILKGEVETFEKVLEVTETDTTVNLKFEDTTVSMKSAWYFLMEVKPQYGTVLPECVTEEHLEYLDALRESGVTNMFGAGEYIESEFGVSKGQARKILVYWMENFSERHGN